MSSASTQGLMSQPRAGDTVIGFGVSRRAGGTKVRKLLSRQRLLAFEVEVDLVGLGFNAGGQRRLPVAGVHDWDAIARRDGGSRRGRGCSAVGRGWNLFDS